jgi:hypothetical protein
MGGKACFFHSSRSPATQGRGGVLFRNDERFASTDFNHVVSGFYPE